MEQDIGIVLATIDLPAEHRGGFHLGDTVNFTFGGNVVHLFSKETEESLLSSK
ncbi:hypothetical protein SDC9_177432 [bioreactor metagenome]|uniref:Uncharacterized protein n=1 Tax=bioreactor metagenome TaxID=1076179 RepID=A0A645GT85_9ZZZZ